MLVSEQFRKCVTFLYVDHVDERGITARKPIGTVFLVSLPLGLRDLRLTYLVTARHVVEAAASSGLVVYLRTRQKAGGYDDRPIDSAAWYIHPKTDVAAALLRGNSATDDFRSLDHEFLITTDFLETHGVMEGDDVFFAGLFVPHAGTESPQPLIRFGNIALMPRERVRVKVGHATYSEIDAYLVEARSWGGQSGSPAFLSLSVDRQPGMIVQTGITFGLLGLVQGHWEQPAAAAIPDPTGEGVVEINMGISIVVPAEKIREVLMGDDAREDREKIKSEVAETPPDPSEARPIADAALGGEESSPLSRDEFFRDLRRASRPERDDKPPRGTE